MAYPYIGEIQAFAFGYCPLDWLPCDGRLVPINQFTPLFALIGTTYGGDGTSTFGLPNLVGRVAMSQGQGPGLTLRTIGDDVGDAAVALIEGEMAWHTHGLQLGDRTTPNGTAAPSGTSVAIDPTFNGFVALPGNTTLAPTAVGLTGGSQAHPNTQPTLAMIYCIATAGEFPSFG